jgi:hypothetical protein
VTKAQNRGGQSFPDKFTALNCYFSAAVPVLRKSSDEKKNAFFCTETHSGGKKIGKIHHNSPSRFMSKECKIKTKKGQKFRVIPTEMWQLS